MSRHRRRLIARLKSASPRVRAKALDDLDIFAWESRLVVQLVIAALEDPDANVRGKAAHEISMARPTLREAVPGLIRNLKDPDVYARYSAASALGYMKVTSPLVIDALTEALSDPRIASDAMEALGQIGVAAKRAVPALLAALERGDHVITAAEALGAIGSPARAAVPALCGVLKSADLSERKFAAEALAGIGPAAGESVAALLEALDDRTFFAKAQAESDVHEKKMSPTLQGRMPWNPGYLRVSIAVALWRIGRREPALATLVAALDDPAYGVRLNALEALGDIDAPLDVAADVAKAVVDPVHSVRALAVSVFAKMRPRLTAALPVLIGALGDAHASVRSNAADELALLGPPAAPALDALDHALRVSDYARVDAAFAIWRIARRETAVSALIEALDDQDGYTSTQAAIRLGFIGSPAIKALSALIALHKRSDADNGDGCEYTSRMALRAIKRIGGPQGWN